MRLFFGSELTKMLACGVGLEHIHGCEVLIHHRLCPLHKVALGTFDAFEHDWVMRGEDPREFVGLQHVAVSGWCHTDFSCYLNRCWLPRAWAEGPRGPTLHLHPRLQSKRP